MELKDDLSQPLPSITIVVAHAANHVIGSGNTIPWKIKEDMLHFKRVTMGKPIIMGRKTYDSIGKPLPGRLNIVVSRSKDLKIEGAEVVGSLEEAIRFCSGIEEACLIGGGELYREGLKYTSKIIATQLRIEVQGDVFFPKLDPKVWHIDNITPEPGNNDDYYFVTYNRLTMPEYP